MAWRGISFCSAFLPWKILFKITPKYNDLITVQTINHQLLFKELNEFNRLFQDLMIVVIY